MRKRIGESNPAEKIVKTYFNVRETSRLASNYPTKEESDALLASPFKTDRDRIKFYSQKYRSKDITEAFEDVYGIKLQKLATLAPIANVNINDIVKLKVNGVTKEGAILDTTNLKYDVKFAVDLWKMPSMQNAEFPKDLEVMVIAKDKNTITVDPLAATYKTFLDFYDKEGLASQYNIERPATVKIKNLKLTPGGYVGNLVVPILSKLTGKDTTVKAFIPGSQIVQNIESDFDKWIGKDVEAFVTTVIKKEDMRPGSDISLICSRKNLINHYGNMNTIQIFKDYTENNDAWKKVQNTTYTGIVTGVVNTSKKCGVFVEVPELNITRIISKPANELVNFKKGSTVKVKLTSFEEPTTMGPLGKPVHLMPYVIEDNVIKSVDVKPVFQLV